MVEIPQITLATPAKILLGNIATFSVAPKLRIVLNEVSEINFEIPAYIFDDETQSYVQTHLYNEVVGRKLLLVENVGWFRIQDPHTSSSGVQEVKQIQAFSLECELADSNISSWDGTFPLYNTTDPTNSVLGMIVALKPSWSIGYINPKIQNYFRTFSINETSLYDFLMNQVQDLYQTAIIFDTYERSINCYDIDELATSSILSMNHDNLVKELDIYLKDS